MKSNKYSWHLRKTEISCNISACSTASGGLQTWANTSSKLGPGTLSLQGTYLHVQHSPQSHQDPASNAVLLPEPRGSPPLCLAPARLQLWAAVPWPTFAASPRQGRRTQANATHMWLPQQSYSCASKLPRPLTCYLHLILANVPGKRQLTSSHVGARVSTAAPLYLVHPCPMSRMEAIVQPPLNMWTRQRLENHRVQLGRDA